MFQRTLNLSKHLSNDEINQSEFWLFTRSQKRSFPDELKCFDSGNHLNASSCLLPLNSIVGSGGLLVVGGGSSIQFFHNHSDIQLFFMEAMF